jgi:hypothetical protein
MGTSLRFSKKGKAAWGTLMLPFLGLVWAVVMSYFFSAEATICATCFELSRGAATKGVLYRCRSKCPCYATEIYDSY